MKIHKIYTENKLFIKTCITFCLILVFSISITVYFINYDMTKDLIETQVKYEKEVLLQVKNHTEDVYDEINKIVNGLYINSSYNSVTNLISPYKTVNKSQNEKNEIVLSTLQNICDSNNNILDILVFDKIQQKTFYYSNKRRDLSIYYDFFNEKDSLVSRATNDIKIIPNHIPDYIIKNQYNNYDTSKLSVITFYINLYDLSYVSEDKKIGVVAININSDILFHPYIDEAGKKERNLFILEGDKLILSSSNKTLKDFKYLQKKEKEQYINKVYSERTGLTFIKFIDRNKINKSVKKNSQKAINIIIITIAIGIIISIMFSRAFIKRIKELVEHIKKIEKGGFNREIVVYDNDEIGYLEKSFSNMCEKLSEYVDTVFVSNIKRKTAEIQALQAQINPHYMFNTLESIRITALINKDYEAANMITILGNMFRWNMRMKDLVVNIQDEIDYIQSYIELQKIRYENGFLIIWDIDEDIMEYAVPKQILQPIIENALYHGNTSNEVLEIVISVKSIDKDIQFKINDNGNGIKKEMLEHIRKGINSKEIIDNVYSIGLKNVAQRIKLLFGEEYGLEIDSTIGKGTEVIIKIPKLSKEEMDKSV